MENPIINGGAGSNIATKSMWKTPKKFFPIVVDNFFEDPESIVKYAKSLPKEIVGRQPGLRSKQLWEIAQPLHNAIIKKALSCHYDLDYVNLSWQVSNLSFHEIPRYSPDKKAITNKGWILQDEAVMGNDEVAGLIYLTPDIDPDSGTSLWNLKPNVKVKIQADTFYDTDKHGWYKEDGTFSNEEAYIKLWEEQQESFVEKMRFQNIFNRMIMYDTMEWHGANSYYHGDGKDVRLTLAFFIGGIESDSEYPMERVKNKEFEEIISSRIQKSFQLKEQKRINSNVK